MFGLRSDGKKIKIKDPIFKIIPHIMNSRIASQNYMVEDIDCSSLDDFIRTKREEGISYNYMHIVMAGLARLFYIRDELNRFIMNGRFYQRYSKDGRNITIALTVKKFLGDGAPETIVKFSFKGDETLEDNVVLQTVDSVEQSVQSGGFEFDANGNVIAAPEVAPTTAPQTTFTNIKFDENGTVVSA